jgi:hypothetical protein
LQQNKKSKESYCHTTQGQLNDFGIEEEVYSSDYADCKKELGGVKDLSISDEDLYSSDQEGKQPISKF